MPASWQMEWRRGEAVAGDCWNKVGPDGWQELGVLWKEQGLK